MFGEDLVEVLEVPGFLIVHVFHQTPQLRVGFNGWRGLSGVDERCGEFAGVIDAKGGIEELFLFFGEGLSTGWLGCVEVGGRGFACCC